MLVADESMVYNVGKKAALVACLKQDRNQGENCDRIQIRSKRLAYTLC